MTYKIFAAMKAFIVYEWKILFIKESSKYRDGTQEGKYNDVWGRVNPWERFDECLLREVREETWLEIEVWRPFFVNEWRHEVWGEKWQIIATYFECYAKTNKVELSDDHESYIWIAPEDFTNYPVVENLHETVEAYLGYKNITWTN